jgi:hypothetical protein
MTTPSVLKNFRKSGRHDGSVTTASRGSQLQHNLAGCCSACLFSCLQVVPILRAGLVLLEQASTLLPASETYHLGYVRDDETLQVRGSNSVAGVRQQLRPLAVAILLGRR